MDIIKMLEAQKELDQFTIYERGGLEVYPRKEIELALRVELGELAQEWGKFKYWKKTRYMVNKERLMEEWADCMHFALSLENRRNEVIEDGKAKLGEYCEEYYEEKFVPDELGIKFKIFDCLTDIYDCFELASRDLRAFQVALIGSKLGFTDEEMEKAYYDKNKINWERMRGNY